MEHILAVWPRMSDLATDLGLAYPTVAAWKNRGQVPAEYDMQLIEAAKRRGATLTLEQLARARKPARAVPIEPTAKVS